MKTDRHIDIMGIVNLTDDSYFADSRCADADAVLMRVAGMVEDGADIVDLGACSTRPGSLPVGADEEWRRLAPVLPVLREAFPDLRLSIDTYWSSVVAKAYDSIGDFMVNDISAGEDDPSMLPLVGRLGLEYVAMHKRGTSVDMQAMTDYEDVTEEVCRYFNAFAAKADSFGIRNWILDPGFGFAKTVEQNYELLSRLPEMISSFRGGAVDMSLRGASATWQSPAPRILIGVSRKSMIYKPLSISPDEALPATQAVHMAALMAGADILRVHDVREARQTAALYNLLDL